MDNIDLNIHNYDLNDLINLFNIPFHFTEEDLKNSKKMVLKTHPDKSGMDKEYFLFFSQAYKYLHKIHQLRQSSTTTNTEYQKDDLWEKEHNVLINGAIKKMDQKEYNNWFNETFEKMRLNDTNEETGYGDWLKSNEDVVENMSKSEMEKYVEKKRGDMRSLIVHQDFQDVNQGSHYDLVRESQSNYGSNVFDKLQFEDLRKAHTESLVPVTEEDFHNRKKYTSIDQLNRDRTMQVEQNKSHLSTHEDKLKEVKFHNEDVDINRAYKLMSQDEKIRENYDKFWSDLKRIKN